jgi:hypothetical protein
VEQSRSYIELIFCGLHHFDLVLEMDEVLEFVSPDILGWNGFIRPQDNMHWRTPMQFTTWLPTGR